MGYLDSKVCRKVPYMDVENLCGFEIQVYFAPCLILVIKESSFTMQSCNFSYFFRKILVCFQKYNASSFLKCAKCENYKKDYFLFNKLSEIISLFVLRLDNYLKESHVTMLSSHFPVVKLEKCLSNSLSLKKSQNKVFYYSRFSLIFVLASCAYYNRCFLNDFALFSCSVKSIFKIFAFYTSCW
ncbi:unnamed protein product [Moneuplotes crassus]|uniref:Uncharacterized protein n=1 Tax=Euplotes crassus TaxID=5936 RepID=A0AAD1XUH1_EUPCR|nr:unnamed protein product [Moneuplotes crassus]